MKRVINIQQLQKGFRSENITNNYNKALKISFNSFNLRSLKKRC